MTTAQARCPRCTTLQPFAGNALLRCNRCGESFYPVPVQEAVAGAQRRARYQRKLGTAKSAAARARVWYAVRACGAAVMIVPMLWILVLQLRDDVQSWPLTRMEGRLVMAFGGLLLFLGQVGLARARAAMTAADTDE